ncbi:hypothetical protein CRYUN_Cryun05aG0252300 [Craigia yunnanensis]
MIKWLDYDLEGQTLTVPSSSIMKLATKSISAHPIVHILLKPEKDTGLLYSSPFLTILEGTDAEMDFNKLLQKQIEQISNLSDASEKDFPDNILWRNKAMFPLNENLNEEGNNSTHIIDSDSSKGNIAIPESNVATTKSSTSKKTKAAFTPSNAKILYLPMKGTKAGSLQSADGGRSNQGQKRKAVYPNKQNWRFSPRNFLPWTRTQSMSLPGKYGGNISR